MPPAESCRVGLSWKLVCAVPVGLETTTGTLYGPAGAPKICGTTTASEVEPGLAIAALRPLIVTLAPLKPVPLSVIVSPDQA